MAVIVGGGPHPEPHPRVTKVALLVFEAIHPPIFRITHPPCVLHLLAQPGPGEFLCFAADIGARLQAEFRQPAPAILALHIGNFEIQV
jgi:hypothetical protein